MKLKLPIKVIATLDELKAFIEENPSMKHQIVLMALCPDGEYRAVDMENIFSRLHESEWKPIETAPKLQKIMLWRKGTQPEIGFWPDGSWHYSSKEFPPTHWKPVPKGKDEEGFQS